MITWNSLYHYIGQIWPNFPVLCATVLKYQPVTDVSTFQTTTVAVLAQCPSRERFGSCSLIGDPMGCRYVTNLKPQNDKTANPSSYLYCRCGTLPSPTTAPQGPEWSSQSNWPRPPKSRTQASRNISRTLGLGVLVGSWNMLECSICVHHWELW